MPFLECVQNLNWIFFASHPSLSWLPSFLSSVNFFLSPLLSVPLISYSLSLPLSPLVSISAGSLYRFGPTVWVWLNMKLSGPTACRTACRTACECQWRGREKGVWDNSGLATPCQWYIWCPVTHKVTYHGPLAVARAHWRAWCLSTKTLIFTEIHNYNRIE